MANKLIRFSRETCSDYYYATQKEWLETNGLGGFASSTIIGANTRRYHGLLVAALNPPTNRVVLLSKMEETLHCHGKSFELSVNQYPMIIHPEGHKNIERFEYDLFPKFIFQVNGVTIEKSVLMIHGEHTIIIRYAVVSASEPFHINVRPLCVFRDYHSLSKENNSVQASARSEDGRFSMRPYEGMPELYGVFDRGHFESKFFWYKNAEYRKEQERGLEFKEDLFSVGYINAPLEAGKTLDIMISIEPSRYDTKPEKIAEFFDAEVLRRKLLLDKFPLKNEVARGLALSADSFLVKGRTGQTVIAGYHWFTDWGRDTMIALPGLTIATGKPELAKPILRAFAQHISEGMIPNRFPDQGESPEYNNVDGTLWYFLAVYHYWKASGDLEFIQNELYEKLCGIIDWHIKGTRYHIKVDADGLLFAGEAGVQLTWMDAKVGDWVVTPRIGKPVEVNALWYNALCIMAELADRFHDALRVSQFGALRDRVKSVFEKVFWNPETRTLYDYVNGDEKSGDLRPNQIFAVSLPFELISRANQKAVVETVGRELLTPYGLRSLAHEHPQFTGVYAGDPLHRDGAYHQGTVWAWLIGPYLEAYLKVHDYSDAAKLYAGERIALFDEQLRDGGLGTISEIFDGDDPFLPKGCIAQAWSVAEILRIAALLEKA